MKQKTRVIIAFGFIEALLAGVWLYLARLGAQQPDHVAPEFQSTLGSTMGAAMGFLAGLGLVIFFFAVKKNRR